MPNTQNKGQKPEEIEMQVFSANKEARKAELERLKEELEESKAKLEELRKKRERMYTETGKDVLWFTFGVGTGVFLGAAVLSLFVLPSAGLGVAIQAWPVITTIAIVGIAIIVAGAISSGIVYGIGKGGIGLDKNKEILQEKSRSKELETKLEELDKQESQAKETEAKVDAQQIAPGTETLDPQKEQQEDISLAAPEETSQDLGEAVTQGLEPEAGNKGEEDIEKGDEVEKSFVGKLPERRGSFVDQQKSGTKEAANRCV